MTDWRSVDLPSLGSVAALAFELHASDQCFGYPNTPLSFALDDLVFTAVPEPKSAALFPFRLTWLARRRA